MAYEFKKRPFTKVNILLLGYNCSQHLIRCFLHSSYSTDSYFIVESIFEPIMVLKVKHPFSHPPAHPLHRVSPDSPPKLKLCKHKHECVGDQMIHKFLLLGILD